MKLIYIIIFVLFLYVIYRWMTHEIKPMLLDKGGFIEGETKKPDFTRKDLKEYLTECEENSIDSELAKEFFIAVYNTLMWEKEPIAPKLSDNRYKLWELDDDIEDVINYIFRMHNISTISWNYDEILNLVTFKDILLYLQQKIYTNR